MSGHNASRMSAPELPRMNRAALIERLVARIGPDPAVVGGIGHSNWDLWAAGHRARNFYMLGSMGLAIPIALGVALAQPKRRVFALEGDGSLLMQMGCLATVAARKPANLAILIFDNGSYRITGGQGTPGEIAGTDYVAVARAAGLAHAAWAADEAAFDRMVEASLTEDGPHVIGLKLEDSVPRTQTPRDPAQIRDRFMRGMGAAPNDLPG